MIMISGLMGTIVQEWTSILNSSDIEAKTRITTYQTDIEKRLNETNVWVDKLIGGTYMWTIDKIDERRENREFIRSGCFYATIRPYKMSLAMDANGIGDVADNGLTIELWFHSDIRDQLIMWTFEADVTITISNKATPDKSKMMTKRCKIQKPEDKKCEYKWNDVFDFFYFDLSADALLVGNCMIVECRVTPI